MTDMGDSKLGALLTVLDLALADDRDKPARQYAWLLHVRECVDSRIASAAAAVHRARRTPPPRKASQPILPPAPTLHSREDTAPHNTERLVAESEAKRPEDYENRTTPVVGPPPGVDRPVVEGSVRAPRHPGKER